MEPSHARRRVLRLGLAALAAPALVRAAPFAREAAPWATASAAPARAAETEEVPIGAIYPLSGPLAVLGDEGLRGLELAVEERNAAGGVLGRRLRLLKADATDPASAAGEAKRLIGERAVALFGTHSGPLSLAAAQAAELAGTPYFELCAGADSLTERGLRALFRACPANGALGSASVDAVADVLAPLWGRPASGMRVALLHRDGAGDGAGIADTQLARLQVRGMVLADRVPYMRDTADLQPIVQRLRAAEVEVVLHAGATGDATLLFGQMRQAGWRPRMVVGAGSAYALADAAAVGPDLDGAMAVSLAAYAVREDACPGVGAAAAAYEKRYGMKPRSGHSLASLVGARVFLDALHRAGGPSLDRLRAAVLAADLPLGGTAAGWGARFDERGQNGRARPVLLQWQGGAPVSVGPEAVAVAPPRARLGA